MKHFDSTLRISEDMKEDVQYKDNIFPIAAYPDSTENHPPFDVQAHWHEEYEAVRLASGKNIYTVNGQSVPMSEGNIIFLKGNVLHDIHNFGSFEAEVLLIHPRIFNRNELYMQKFLKALTYSGRDYYLIDQSRDWHREFFSVFSDIYNCCRNNEEGHELIATIHAYRLLSVLYTEIMRDGLSRQPEIIKSSSIDSLKKMIFFIQEEYQNEIAVTDIAKAANISKSTCDKLFRHILSQSPIEYLIDYRINQSIHLLFEGATVTEAALGCGFASIAYYSHIFKKKTGTSPSRFCKENRENQF